MAQGQDNDLSGKCEQAGSTSKLVLLCICCALFLALFAGSTVAQAAEISQVATQVTPSQAEDTPEADNTPEVQETATVEEITATPLSTATPILTATATEELEPTATSVPAQEVRWEEQTLLELADRLGWPAVVTVDNSGRYLIRIGLDEQNWAQASIRPFSYITSAEAAFDAEQEDARLSGYLVQPVSFNTYPAYSATFADQNGVIVERRLRWRSETWIFGVSLRGTGAAIAALDPNDIGDELLALAIEHGLPTPSGGQDPTPLPPTQGATPSPTSTPISCALSFPDVSPQYWAYRYITDLACRGIVTGRSDGNFRPDYPTTRAQLAKMIVLSEGWTLLNPSRASFGDVDRSHIFFRYIETAYSHGILSGYPNKQFKPNSYVTRAQVAKMLVRARAWPQSLQGNDPVPLCDVSTGHWAWIYIQVAIQRGTFSGYPNGCFLPDASATRAQIAKVLVQSHR